MPSTKTPQELVATWKKATLKERSAAQPHFIGLCQIIGRPAPEEDDPTGERYTFEAGADRQRGGQGWAADLSDTEIRSRLLALNLERAAQGAAPAGVADDDEG